MFWSGAFIMVKSHASSAGQVVNDFLGSAQIFTSAVSDLLEAQLEELSEHKVTFAQIKLLKMVSLTQDYSISNVAQFLGVSTAAASRAVDRLVRRNLLQRTEDARDRRVVQLALTDDGAELLERYDESAQRTLERVFDSLPQDQLQEASAFLDRLSVRIVEGQDEDVGHLCFRCGIHFRNRCLLRKVRRDECFFHTRPRPGNGG
jgi:DNA-binding MarR family transcriptional regulator